MPRTRNSGFRPRLQHLRGARQHPLTESPSHSMQFLGPARMPVPFFVPPRARPVTNAACRFVLTPVRLNFRNRDETCTRIVLFAHAAAISPGHRRRFHDTGRARGSGIGPDPRRRRHGTVTTVHFARDIGLAFIASGARPILWRSLRRLVQRNVALAAARSGPCLHALFHRPDLVRPAVCGWTTTHGDGTVGRNPAAGVVGRVGGMASSRDEHRNQGAAAIC